MTRAALPLTASGGARIYRLLFGMAIAPTPEPPFRSQQRAAEAAHRVKSRKTGRSDSQPPNSFSRCVGPSRSDAPGSPPLIGPAEFRAPARNPFEGKDDRLKRKTAPIGPMPRRSLTYLDASRVPSIAIEVDMTAVRHQETASVSTEGRRHRKPLERRHVEPGEGRSGPRVEGESAPAVVRPQAIAVPCHIDIVRGWIRKRRR